MPRSGLRALTVNSELAEETPKRRLFVSALVTGYPQQITPGEKNISERDAIASV